MPQNIIWLALIGLHRSGFQGEVVYMNYLLILTLLWATCCDDEINEQRIFRQHQLLRCQAIEQCLILDADVHKEGKPHADKGEEVGNRYLLRTSYIRTIPTKAWFFLHVVSVRKRRMSVPCPNQKIGDFNTCYPICVLLRLLYLATLHQEVTW